ncbi:MAG: hypothetical protein ABIP06_03605 [Pyrinomonadaceae bacterium]
MKLKRFSFVLMIVAGLFLTVSVSAQNTSFSDPNVEYTFEIPEANWILTNKSPNVEYVYGDKKDGHFEVRKLSVKAGGMMADIIRDEEQKLQFLPGYVAGKEENFQSAYSGRVFNFEYVRSSRNMSGRYYFVKAGDKTIYVLRFAGNRDKLRSIRNETDLIARTFKLK